MHIFDSQVALKQYLSSLIDAKSTIGFVPTMGALHEGHLSLLTESIANNDYTVVSIFVNPTQFNSSEDLEKYPRTLASDCEKIQSVSDSILVFAPSAADIYDGLVVSEHFDFDGLEHQMEGKFRAGHFDGVGTIVKRLFEIVIPNKAYFGEKDFQQLQIVRKLVEKIKSPVQIVGCPIFREKNGLAMSSRNERLSPLEREEAKLVFETLCEVKNKFENQDVAAISNWVASVFASHQTIELEYFQIAEETTLLPCETRIESKKYRAFIAVYINTIRLIDTISLN